MSASWLAKQDWQSQVQRLTLTTCSYRSAQTFIHVLTMTIYVQVRVISAKPCSTLLEDAIEPMISLLLHNLMEDASLPRERSQLPFGPRQVVH